jgi:hypothetical protein
MDDDEEGSMSWGEYQVGPDSRIAPLSAIPSLELINAQDKNRLRPALRSELARRLRRGILW